MDAWELHISNNTVTENKAESLFSFISALFPVYGYSGLRTVRKNHSFAWRENDWLRTRQIRHFQDCYPDGLSLPESRMSRYKNPLEFIRMKNKI